MAPQLIFGDVSGIEDLNELKSALKEHGITRLDSAARYGGSPHASEKRLGEAKMGDSFTIDSKILYTAPDGGDHEASKVTESVKLSLEDLGVDKVNVLYYHGPDYNTPLADQARALDEQFKAGKFKLLGVSNWTPSTLQEYLDIASEENLVKPSVYQGQYNLLCRAYEDKIFPLCRDNNMVFNAYSPLAGGFLLGNFTEDGHQSGNRFGSDGMVGVLYKRWYDKPALHEAVKKMKALSEKTGIAMGELSLRWLAYHSQLCDGDGYIVGATKIASVGRNVAQVGQGPLEESVAKELSGLWDSVPKEDGANQIDFEFMRQGKK